MIALHWLKDTLARDGDTIGRLAAVLANKKNSPAIADDLQQGFGGLPAWMQNYLRTVPGFGQQAPASAPTGRRNNKKTTSEASP